MKYPMVRLIMTFFMVFASLRIVSGNSLNEYHPIGIMPAYDVRYYRLELNVDPAVRYVSGAVTCYFYVEAASFDYIQFNLRNNMTVDSVRYHNSKITNYSFSDAITLNINLPGTLPQFQLDSITVYYQGTPVQDAFGAFSIGTTVCSGQNNKVMWTLSEPYGAKNWWPCKESLTDKADSVDIIVTCPVPYRVGANGLMIDSTTNGNITTYRWKHKYPIPAYLVAFAVADYTSYIDKVAVAPGDTIQVLNYVYPCNTSAKNQTPNIIPIFQYFISKFGQYPYHNEKYGHAQCGFGGGMEHSTMSFMGGFSKYLMAHELAHQWFGDKVTCGSWHDIWLNEGFATYLEGLTCEQGLGDQTWYNWKVSKINSVTSNNYGSTYVPDTTDVNRIFNTRLTYNKGALIVHMLRWVLGETLFFETLYNYLHDPELAYGAARTEDLIDVIQTTAGVDMTGFFNDWYYSEGWPNYNIQWSKDTICDKVYVTINQSHSAGQGVFFEMPVPVLFSNGNSSELVVFNQNAPGKTEFTYKLNFSPTTATFDPDKWLCAKSTVTKVAFNKQRIIQWTGNVSNDWHTGGNWDCNIPTINDAVLIPSGTPACIVGIGMIAECKKITVDPNAELIVETTGTLKVKD